MVLNIRRFIKVSLDIYFPDITFSLFVSLINNILYYRITLQIYLLEALTVLYLWIFLMPWGNHKNHNPLYWADREIRKLDLDQEPLYFKSIIDKFIRTICIPIIDITGTYLCPIYENNTGVLIKEWQG